ncbi:daptomycin-sensing surface protein LiaX [Vagococcus sp. JNUCC 83]
MNERERILELVKQGILTTEEALVLLENIATEKDEKLIDNEAKLVNYKTSEEKEQASYNDSKALEKILEKLAEEENRKSVEYDELTVEIQGLRQDIREIEEQLMVFDTMEDLDTLPPEKEAEREQLKKDLAYLKETDIQLTAEKAELNEELKHIKNERKETQNTEKILGFDIPKEWKEQTNEKLNQATGKVEEAGKYFGEFLKKTVDAVSSTVSDNVEWKDVNIKVPGVSSHSFTHEFLYPNSTATLIDVKVANGKVTFKTWNQPDVKVIANIKFYGKLNNNTPFEAFIERSEIVVDEENISFQIPNKRLSCDLEFFLPKHLFDHVSVKMLNGDIKVEDMLLGDIFLKSTNGKMTINRVKATMLEVEGVNGDIKVEESEIVDFIGQTVNGEVVSKSSIVHTSMSLINGAIKITSKDATPKKIKATVVNGDIKVSLAKDLGVQASCQTNFGSIKNRLEKIDILKEKKERMNQLVDFVRQEEEIVQLSLNTTTGSIYLKDND